MKAIKRALVLTLAVLAMGACAKKDGNFGQKNAMGTRSKNQSANQTALDAGLKIDFFDIHTLSLSPLQFSVTLMVNDLQTVATLQQMGTSVSSAQTNIGTYTVKMDSVCTNQDCNPLVLSAIASQNGQPYGQVVYSFYRKNSDSSQDRYQLFTATQIKPNINDVVNFLVVQPDAD